MQISTNGKHGSTPGPWAQVAARPRAGGGYDVKVDETPTKIASAPAELEIEALARSTQTSVRNIRAYQDRGLLPPPRRRGRAAIYDDRHRSRLTIINALLKRGYTLASIGELLEALERGDDIASLIGLESAVTSPWSDETPQTFSLGQLTALYGVALDPRQVRRAVALGLITPQGNGFATRSPRLLRAGAELAQAGVPLAAVLDLIEDVRAHLERVAESFVRVIERHVFDRYGDGLPPAAETRTLGELVWRLRPLAQSSVSAELARAMESAAERHLGDRLAALLERMRRQRED
jgi:Predicted transcriptional regulators